MAKSKKEIDAGYYKRHRTKTLRKAAKYRRKNRRKILTWQRRNHRAVYQRFMAQPKNRVLYLYKKAILRGHPFDVRLRYVLVANPPTHCGCCGKQLDYSTGRGINKRDSPSLDRWDNSQGYTLENTRVICYRCNELKRDATLAELETVVRYMMPERADRITRLIEERLMTPEAAATVVDAAMFGIGCTEGTVRARIEQEKKSQ